MLKEIDTKQDGLLDVEEFAEWLTNVNATVTIGSPGFSSVWS